MRLSSDDAPAPLSAALAPFDAHGAEPLYRQVYRRFRDAIDSGLLKTGDRVPSSRMLARELGLARGTVEAAYTQLTAEGYLAARGQAGTVVAAGPKQRAPAHTPAASVSAWPAGGINAPTFLPFQMGLPALDAFPRKLWSRLAARAARATQAAQMIYPPIAGMAALRAQIAAYLQLSRGVPCSPAQVFVTAGYRDTVDLVQRAVLAPGDRAWVEDPGYPPVRELLRGAGHTPVPVPVDGEGLMVDEGVRLAPDARAAFVTPAHHSPLCMSLSLARRTALLDWAADNRAWIVEDDYDGEYRYASRPLPALQSLDRDGRVLYMGTFSKVLFPGIRLGYLVVPEAEIARFDNTRHTYSSGSPALMQTIVSDFMAEGHFVRHIQRMRNLYGERREAAVRGLQRALGGALRADPQPGGMHLVMRLDGSDSALAGRMREQGMASLALSDWNRSDHAALLLGFTNIESEEKAEALGRRIAQLL